MTAAVVDLATHRERRDRGAHDRDLRHDHLDHWTRLNYGSFAELLADADRVVGDLTAGGQLFVSTDELRFTAQRLHALLRGAMRSAPSDMAEAP